MAVKTKVEQAARCSHMHSRFFLGAGALKKTKDDSVKGKWTSTLQFTLKVRAHPDIFEIHIFGTTSTLYCSHGNQKIGQMT